MACGSPAYFAQFQMPVQSQGVSFVMTISADVFEVFLKCSTKCWLRAAGEPTSGNAYAKWVRSQNESYRADAAKLLTADVPANEWDVGSVAKNLKTAKWRLALGVELCMPFVTRVSTHAGSGGR